ncbi:MAG: hypothetical protein LBG81_02695 [Coriobacteriaceae bacterium]|jgi:hypothetical protein|nr:hypothetical protein [Coriobacteriaceae bacterium]
MSPFLGDSLVYARLKARLARAALIRSASSVISSDFKEERNLEDRLYQAYALALILGWLVLMWVYLLDATNNLFQEAGHGAACIAVLAFLFAPLGLFVLLSARNARTAPWRMSHADIAFVAASPLKTAGIMVWEVLSSVLLWSFAAALLGFLVGSAFSVCVNDMLPFLGEATGLDEAAKAILSASPVGPLCFGALSACCAVLWAWLIGVMRMAVPMKWNTRYLLCIGACLVLLVAVVALAASPLFMPVASSLMLPQVNGSTGLESLLQPAQVHMIGAQLRFIAQGLALPSLCLLLALCILGLAAFIAASRHVDVTKVVHEGSFNADLQSIRHMPLYDAAGYAEIRRKKRLARRRPRGSLPGGQGSKALFSRAFLSHARQLDGLPSIMFWGMMAAPVSQALLLSPQPLLFWMLWAQALLLMPQGVREVTRCFREDMGNTLVGSHLPFSTLRLFLGDCALPGAICAAVSVATIAIMTSLGAVLPLDQVVFADNRATGTFGIRIPELLWAIALGLGTNMALFLCAALECIPLFGTGRQASYELAALVFAAGLFLTALVQIPLLSLFFILAFCTVLALLLKATDPPPRR